MPQRSLRRAARWKRWRCGAFGRPGGPGERARARPQPPRAPPRLVEDGEPFRYSRGREKPIDADFADVLLNAVLIFGFTGVAVAFSSVLSGGDAAAGVDAASEYGVMGRGAEGFAAAPGLGLPPFAALLALGALVVGNRTVRAGAHQLLDLFRSRLDKAWNGGRWQQHQHHHQREEEWRDDGSSGWRTDEGWRDPASRSGVGAGQAQERGAPSSSSPEPRREGRGGGSGRSPMGRGAEGVAKPFDGGGRARAGGAARYQRPRGRPGDQPLFLRVLFSVFPFMKFWGGFL